MTKTAAEFTDFDLTNATPAQAVHTVRLAALDQMQQIHQAASDAAMIAHESLPRDHRDRSDMLCVGIDHHTKALEYRNQAKALRAELSDQLPTIEAVEAMADLESAEPMGAA